MPNSKYPKDPKDPKEPKVPTAPAGRIAHDGRGNAVWQWGQGTGQNPMDSTSKMLKQLEVPGLSLLDESTTADPMAADPQLALKRKGISGFNPYEVEVDPGKPAPRPAPAARAPKPVVTRPAAKRAAPAAKSGLIDRLFGKDRDR
jgi:hypothetical protein